MEIKCYRTGGCGPYEMYSCHECPANNPVYKCKNCKYYEICQNDILAGFTVICDNYPALLAYMRKRQKEENKNKAKEEETKKVKITKMKKNIPTKVKEEKEEVNSCPACTLKKYKSGTKFLYSFAPSFYESAQENEEIQFYIGKNNKTNEWMLYVHYFDEDYDLREINREFSVPIKYCPVCGRELK